MIFWLCRSSRQNDLHNLPLEQDQPFCGRAEAQLWSRPDVVVATLLGMTSYQPAAAPRFSPAKLAIAGSLTVVLSIALIFGGSLLAEGVRLPPYPGRAGRPESRQQS
jgi:hypothetical protein